MTMNFLYQCNDKYAPYCGVSITSLFENNKGADDICVYILDDGIIDTNKEKFKTLSKQYNREIVFVQTEELTNKLNDLGIATYRGSQTANFKMFVSEYIPDSVERLVYIDSDTIVIGDLSKLFQMEMNNLPIAMAKDSVVGEYKRCIGFNYEDDYFNAGVILFDIGEWNKQKCAEKIVEHVKTVRAHYPAPDQDLLNVNIKDDIYILQPMYNLEPAVYMFTLKNYLKVFNHKYYTKEEIEFSKCNPKIYHFFRVMGEFPWHKDNMHPFNDLFDEYLQISPWCDYIKESANNSIIFKIEKIMYKILPEWLFIRIFKLSHEIFMKKSNQLSLKNENNNLM